MRTYHFLVWVILTCFLVLGCAASRPDSTSPCGPTFEPNRPAFGLYQVDMAALQPQVKAYLFAAGETDKAKEKLEEFEQTSIWLLIDNLEEPVLISQTKRGADKTHLLMFQQQDHFELRLMDDPDAAVATCTSASAVSLDCSMSLLTENGVVFKTRAERSTAPHIEGLPAPGLYVLEDELSVSEKTASLLAWLEGHNLDSEQTKEQAVKFATAKTVLAVHGDSGFLLRPLHHYRPGGEPNFLRHALVKKWVFSKKGNGFVAETSSGENADLWRENCVIIEDGLRCQRRFGDVRIFRRLKG